MRQSVGAMVLRRENAAFFFAVPHAPQSRFTKRSALTHSRVMIHQPSGGARGQVTDIQIAARESARIKELTAKVLAEHTGKEIAQIHEDTERDNFMTSEEAKAYGLVDQVIYPGKAANEDEESDSREDSSNE